MAQMTNNLDEDVLRELVGHLSLSSLKAFSLSSKDWRTFCQPYLYRKLDLTRDDGQYVRVVDMRSAGYLKHVRELVIPDAQAINALSMFLNRLKGGLRAYFPRLETVHVNGLYGLEPSEWLDDLFPGGTASAGAIRLRTSCGGRFDGNRFKDFGQNISHLRIVRSDISTIDFYALTCLPNLASLHFIDLYESGVLPHRQAQTVRSSFLFPRLKDVEFRWSTHSPIGTSRIRPTLQRIEAPDLRSWSILPFQPGRNTEALRMVLPTMKLGIHQLYTLILTTYGCSYITNTQEAQEPQLAGITRLVVHSTPEQTELWPLYNLLSSRTLLNLSSIHLEAFPPVYIRGRATGVHSTETLYRPPLEDVLDICFESQISVTIAALFQYGQSASRDPLGAFEQVPNNLVSLRLVLPLRTSHVAESFSIRPPAEPPVTFSKLDQLYIEHGHDGQAPSTHDIELDLDFLIAFLSQNSFPRLRVVRLDIFRTNNPAIVETLTSVICKGNLPSLDRVQASLVDKQGYSWQRYGGNLVDVVERLQTALEVHGVEFNKVAWTRR